MELASSQLGDRTIKVLNSVGREGLMSLGKRIPLTSDGEGPSLNKLVDEYWNYNHGVLLIPSGRHNGLFLRNAVIEDTIEVAKNNKFQNSLKCLESFAKRPITVELSYDPINGEVYDASKIDDSMPDRSWALAVNPRTVNVSFSKDRQISEVVFEIDDDRNVSAGLTKEQIMVMTSIAQHNKNHWRRNSNLLTPMPQIKRGIRNTEKLRGGEDIWKFFALQK
ncbi:MAG TPA: hypothetical protein VI795_03340 [Patescibacteria group bacterium]|nr:hypothetical protein [Patescibacteria group bacterium]